MKNKPLLLVVLLVSSWTLAQVPNMGGMGKNMNVGRFYGKVIDSLTGKPVEFAVVQLHGMKFDTTSKSMKPAIMGGQLSESNGDFSIDGLPPFGQFTLKITALGYKTYEQKVSFNLNMQQMGKDAQSGNWQNALNNVDKDLGNIKLTPDVKQFKEVVVDGSDPEVELKLDRKVYNVEKNLSAAGGTAEDVMKNVPSVNVDMDGNVTMRNSTPEILIDGKPTTLTLDQIPADAIASVEVITNPSAKYDASGGGGGILNIILKKNRKPGYNGSVRANLDSRMAYGGGLDLNVREGKWNFFVNSHTNKRNSLTTGHTERYNLIGSPITNVYQQSKNITEGFFGMGRMGVDYFMNNRNTLTLSGNLVSGSFIPVDELNYRTDTIYTNDTASSSYFRDSDTRRSFMNYGGSLQYKHLYTKPGKELTADLHYNRSTSESGGDYFTNYYDQNNNELYKLQQESSGGGENEFITIQTDYVNPITDKKKLEMGAKASFKEMWNYSKNYNVNVITGEKDFLETQSMNYRFFDQIFGAYMTYGAQMKKLGYQLGLRAEASFYKGELVDSTLPPFYIEYPVSLFPTAFLTYQINAKQDLQMSYTRKISRPGFFQLIPFTDYSDSLNLSRGNPELRPEFTNSLEINYMNQFSKGNSLMASVYFKQTTDLMTRYQAYEYDSVLMQSAIINTYRNADQSYSYGLEVNLKKTVKSWMDFSINGNIYNSYINGANIDSTLTSGLVSWFVKANTNYKLPKNFSLQISGRYFSKTKLPAGTSSRGSGSYGQGGNMSAMFWGSNPATAQGYTEPNWEVEASVRYEFMKEKRASLTLSVSDIFRSKVNATYSESVYFTQNTVKLKDAQIFKLAFSYRFGKFDASIFKRKNMKINTDGMDGGGGM